MILDPFPVSTSILATLQAFSMGVPVITMPSDRLGGRFALALYSMMEYGFGNETVKEKRKRGGAHLNGENDAEVHLSVPTALIVSSVTAYVSTALAIAHNSALRARHTREILSRQHLIFNSEKRREEAVQDWRAFLSSAMLKVKEKEKRNQ